MRKEIVGGVLLLGLAPYCAVAQKNSAPNIVFILADDLGYGDLAALNGSGKIPTPNIDRLAREGVNFMDAHSSSSVSTPSRYGVLTGRYNWRSRLKKGVLRWYDTPLIPAERTTMAGMLSSRGYRTACIGKWHLGMDFPTKGGAKAVDTETEYNLDFTKEITGGPRDVGFDYFFGVDCPNYPPYCFIENRKTQVLPSHFYPLNGKLDCRAGRGLENWNLEEVLPAVVDHAVAYIHESAGKKQPFFLYLPLTSPHTPIVPVKEFQGKTGMNLYTDFVMQTDDAVGKVLKALEDNGIDKNTLVVFTSDNGCSPMADFPFLKSRGHNPSYIFRGMKSDLYEGGHHIGCMVRWPERFKPHQVEQTVCLTDFMATFAHIAGYRLSDNEAEDSYNLLPLLENVKEPSTLLREATVHHSVDGSFAIRQGRWKLMLINYSGGWSKPSKRNGYAEPYQLYDMESDPEEKTNLYSSHKEKAEELRKLLVKYIKEGRSTPGKPQQNDPVPEWPQIRGFME